MIVIAGSFGLDFRCVGLPIESLRCDSRPTDCPHGESRNEGEKTADRHVVQAIRKQMRRHAAPVHHEIDRHYAHYRDKVLGEDDLVGSATELKIDRPIDRIYFVAPDGIEVREPGRKTVSPTIGFPDTMVWNPGEQGGAALDDLEPGGYARMVCIEAAVARTPAIVSPGETWSGTQRLIASSEK